PPELPMICGWLFANDEDGLAGSGQPELLAREPLDGRGVAPQGPDVRGEARVVGLELIDLAGERVGPLALAHELEQAAVAEERAHDETDDHDDRGEDRGLLAEAHFGPATLVPGHFN